MSARLHFRLRRLVEQMLVACVVCGSAARMPAQQGTGATSGTTEAVTLDRVVEVLVDVDPHAREQRPDPGERC